ncbi:DUF2933 domain-containing protein [bacterium]|nr:DUF2933 domain-containing protein [bacterium]
MNASTQNPERSVLSLNRVLIAFCAFLAIAGFMLWEEHRAHILGILPWVLLLLCPVIHLFLHRHHGVHGPVRERGREAHVEKTGGAS